MRGLLCVFKFLNLLINGFQLRSQLGFRAFSLFKLRLSNIFLNPLICVHGRRFQLRPILHTILRHISFTLPKLDSFGLDTLSDSNKHFLDRCFGNLVNERWKMLLVDVLVQKLSCHFTATWDRRNLGVCSIAQHEGI
jgi:hypothetical protein